MFLVRFLLGRLIGRLLSLTVLVALLAIGGWWFFIREDNQVAKSAPAIPESVKQSASPAAGASPGAQDTPLSASGQTFTILADQSEAAYFAGEKLASLPLPSTAKGTTKEVSGSFVLGEGGLDLSQPATFTVGLTELKSDEARRDNRVQRALETSRYPAAKFTITKLTGYPGEFPAGQEVAMQMTGTLDLHGVQKEVTWDVKARKEGAGLAALATLTLKYSDFNIARPNIAGFVTVDESLTLQVQIVAQAG